MRVITKHAGVIRALDRLIKHPTRGIRVECVHKLGSTYTYNVNAPNMLDLAHEVPQLSEHTAEIKLG